MEDIRHAQYNRVNAQIASSRLQTVRTLDVREWNVHVSPRRSVLITTKKGYDMQGCLIVRKAKGRLCCPDSFDSNFDGAKCSKLFYSDEVLSCKDCVGQDINASCQDGGRLRLT